MKILNNSYNKQFKIKLKNSNAITFKRNQNTHAADTTGVFQTPEQTLIKAQLAKHEEEYEHFIHGKGKVTLDDYEKIIHKNPGVLLFAEKKIAKNKKGLNSTPLSIAKAAIGIKKLSYCYVCILLLNFHLNSL